MVTGLIQLQSPINIRAYLPLVENMPDGNAIRPGDVIQMSNGYTVQVFSLTLSTLPSLIHSRLANLVSLEETRRQGSYSITESELLSMGHASVPASVN